MDKTIPGSAAAILDFIAIPETGGDGDSFDYTDWNGFKEHKLPKKLTSMTLSEVLAVNWKAIGAQSSAAGRYQIINKTLRGLIADLGLSLKTKFSADLQDRLAYHLLRKRGYDAWVTGRISTVEFGKRLAMEWASLPVLAGTKNYKGVNIKRGTSYYAGDGLNKHGVSADKFERMLEDALVYKERFSVAVPEARTSKTVQTVIAASGGAVGAGAVVASDPASLPDITTITTVAAYAKDAWVIGPVFGGIVLAAIAVGAIIWWRKKG